MTKSRLARTWTIHRGLAASLCGFLAMPLVACGHDDSAPIAGSASGGAFAPSSGGGSSAGSSAESAGGTSADSRPAAAGGSNARTGSTLTVGGNSAAGGMVSSGGTWSTQGGSHSMNGGSSATGGSNRATGGAATTSGTKAGGGTSATGGRTANGGGVKGGTEAGGGSSAAEVSTGGLATGGALAAGGRTGTGGARATFRNPLNSSHGSDPFMTYYDGKYYLAATTWGTTLTMKSGTTVAALKAAPATVVWSDNTPSRKGNMWAPEFHLLDNGSGAQRWYHYYTAGDGSDLGTQRSYVLESDGMDPMGPYHFKARLLDYWAIDASVLKVGTQLYLMFSAWQGSTQNIWIIAMSNPWTVTGNRTQLSAPTYAWEQEGTDSVNEGPVALYHDGRTFVTYSASQCGSPGYKLGLLELVASNPLAASAWKKSATAVFQAANGNYGPGHNGFFLSPDGTENWIVYHAVSNAAGSCWTDRTTRIQMFTWNLDGTPNFGSPLSLGTDIRIPSGE